MLWSMGMWFTLTRGVMVLYYGLEMLILACHQKNREKKSCHKLEIHIQAIHGEVPEYALLAVHGGLQCEFFCMIFPFNI